MKAEGLQSAQRDGGVVARRQQRGAVLIIGLILLVVMAMIGMTGMQTTTQQERMARVRIQRW